MGAPPTIPSPALAVAQAFGGALAEGASGARQLAALDCGAGIGRISEELLLHHFQQVDLIEPSAHLLAEARKRLTGPGPKCVSVYPIPHTLYSIPGPKCDAL